MYVYGHDIRCVAPLLEVVRLEGCLGSPTTEILTLVYNIMHSRPCISCISGGQDVCMQKNISAKCKECPEQYGGETGRFLETRLEEHEPQPAET